MARRRKARYFWHTPAEGWHSFYPTPAGAGILSLGQDLVSVLVDTESSISDRPEEDRFRIERIIGQYHFTSGADAVPTYGNAYLHSRIYVSDTDQTNIALRDLTVEDDAETSFLWHQVDPYEFAGRAGNSWGTWSMQGSISNTFGPAPWMGRFGHFDVKVGRRVSQGEALIWHTQIRNSGAPLADEALCLKQWVRILVKELL